MRRLQSIKDLVDWRLCVGCGACSYICPERISMVDYPDEGIRPTIKEGSCLNCTACLEVCPVSENDRRNANQRPGLIAELVTTSGPVMELWQGHALDPEIRGKGSSGGALTALSLYCLEKHGMQGVLHIGQDPESPIRNKTRMSKTRGDLLYASGSRYAPASACDRLDLIESSTGPCVFIGQPSEVTALRKAQQIKPALDQKVGLAMSFFCAGSPSSKGTEDLLKKMGIDLSNLSDLRYRGNGWPGHFAPTEMGQDHPSGQISYRESWSFLQSYRPYSTYLWPDGGGEDADISCGDPWYQEPDGINPGSSLIVVRTELGKRIIAGAIANGYLDLRPATPKQLVASQKNLINKRRAIWGRIAVLRLFGLPTPRLKGFYLFRNWMGLSMEDKLRSTIGTARRIFSRKYYKRLNLEKVSESELQKNNAISI